MNQYIFILGNHPDLSIAEIASYFAYNNYKLSKISIASNILLVNTNADLEKNKIIDHLGGTIKITKILATQNDINSHILFNYLPKDKSKIKFGISCYNFTIKNRKILILNKELKKLAKNSGINLNFILPKDNTYLSSAQIFQKIIKSGFEINIINHEKKYIYAQTIAVQNISLNTLLDYGIPKPNPKEGMLPPKLARIMVNLALNKNINNNFTIYDPFCGSGRIVMESLLKNIFIFASDINPDAIKATLTNCRWIIDNFNLNKSLLKNIFVADATKSIKINNIDAIVSEPSLGPSYKNSPNEKIIIQELQKLSKLYLNTFENFKKVIKPNGKIICVFPIINNKKLSDLIIDKIKKMGYYKLQEFKYFRKYQIVKRQIFVFVFKQK